MIPITLITVDCVGGERMSSENTTVSVDREETYPRLNEYRRTLSGDGPGEEATFDDAIRELLSRRSVGGEGQLETDEAIA